MRTKRFRVLLRPYEGMNATGITVPFDVQKTFGTRARVPVRGTINGFPYRSSIFPTGEGTHYVVVNKQVRERSTRSPSKRPSAPRRVRAG